MESVHKVENGSTTKAQTLAMTEQTTLFPVLAVTGDQILLPLGGPFSGSFLGVTWEITSVVNVTIKNSCPSCYLPVIS